MASPSVVTVAEGSTTTDGLSHTQAISTFGSGTLGIIILAVDGNPTISSNGGAWTEFGTRDDHGGAFVVSFWYRVLDGTETSAVFNFGASEKAASIAYEISGAEAPATQLPEVTTQENASSTSAATPQLNITNPPKDVLYIKGAANDGEELDDDTWGNTSPTNYTPSPPRQITSGTGGAATTNVSLETAERQVLSSTSSGTGSFANDVAHTSVGFTIAVHAVGTGPQSVTLGALTPASVLGSFQGISQTIVLGGLNAPAAVQAIQVNQNIAPTALNIPAVVSTLEQITQQVILEAINAAASPQALTVNLAGAAQTVDLAAITAAVVASQPTITAVSSVLLSELAVAATIQALERIDQVVGLGAITAAVSNPAFSVNQEVELQALAAAAAVSAIQQLQQTVTLGALNVPATPQAITVEGGGDGGPVGIIYNWIQKMKRRGEHTE